MATSEGIPPVETPTEPFPGSPTTVVNVKQAIEPWVQHAQEYVREVLSDKGQILGILTWLIVGLVVSAFVSAIFTGSAIFLAFATPIFIFLSPILIPLGTIALLIALGLLSAAGLGVAAVSAVFWFYKYVKGEEPPFSDRVDAARNRIAGTAKEVKAWTRDQTNQVQAAASA